MGQINDQFFKLEEDIFLFYAYIPPTNSKYFDEGDQDVLDLLRFENLNCRLGKHQEELNFMERDDEVFHAIDTL